MSISFASFIVAVVSLLFYLLLKTIFKFPYSEIIATLFTFVFSYLFYYYRVFFGKSDYDEYRAWFWFCYPIFVISGLLSIGAIWLLIYFIKK